jgi:glycosyltransferase involved in cell wall biosynthesis
MKICHIGNPSSLATKVFLEYFSAHGHEVHTFGWGSYPYKLNENIIHHNLSIRSKKAQMSQKIQRIQNGLDGRSGRKESNLRPLLDLYEFIRIKITVNLLKPDIVHGHEASGNGYTTASFRRFPKVLTCWGSDINKFPWESKWVYYKVNYALKNSDIIHVTDELFGKKIVDSFGVDPAKVKCLRTGIDTNLFSPEKIDPKRLEAIRKEIGVNENDFVILYPAGFRDKDLQNYINIVKAFVDLARRDDRLKLVMLTYTRRSGYDEIKKILDENDLWGRVRIIDQYLPHEDMPYIYTIADIMVLIHDVDQMAASIAESMFMGTILLMSRIETYERVFKDGENVIFTNQKDPADIREKLKYMIDNHQNLIDRFRGTNMEIMKKRHSQESLMKKVLEMYESLISR